MASKQTRILDPVKILKTIRILQSRISERFPDSGLSNVAADLMRVADENDATAEHIRKGDPRIRFAVAVVLIGGLGGLAVVLGGLARGDAEWWRPKSGPELIGVMEASIATVVFLGAAVIYLLSLDRRWRRERALEKIHELRSIAHVVDMHQLVKDPDRLKGNASPTESSPKLEMTNYEVGRYLDYCTELLALISKIAALYLQGYSDQGAVSAVDELETLTTGLARKIWQKIMIIDRLTSES